jgi:hypothetical protein
MTSLVPTKASSQNVNPPGHNEPTTRSFTIAAAAPLVHCNINIFAVRAKIWLRLTDLAGHKTAGVAGLRRGFCNREG